MEVHHPHHAPKNWKEYFGEFFMLFLAVSLGFLVENQREHYVEGHRAEELAQALLKDLVADSIDFYKFRSIRKIDRNSIDSAIKIIETRGISTHDSILYYHFIKGVFVWRHPEFRYANMDQIISSGSLRYFKNDELIHAISDLKMELKKIEFRQEREKEYFYSFIQPLVVDHVELAYQDSLRLGLSRESTLNLLKNNPSKLSKKDFFFDVNEKGFVNKTVNALRGVDFLMQVTQSSYYVNYENKLQHLIQVLRKDYPDISTQK